MGMYDEVKYEAKCIECGHLLTSWQSKSRACILDLLEPWQVDNMYTLCPRCRTWNEYDIETETETTSEGETIVKNLKIILNKEESTKIDMGYYE